jgi:phosphatidate cytidylyltransferase
MKRVLTAVVLIPLVLLVVFRAPLWLFALVLAGIVVLALHEFLNIAEGYGIKPLKGLTYAVSLFAVLGLAMLSSEIFFLDFPARLGIVFSPAILLVLPIIFGIPLVFRNDMRMALPAAAVSAFGVLYLAVSLSLLIPLRQSAGNDFLLVFVLFSVWAGDIAAYYVGRSFGRHRLAPVVSPKKSWEGAIASVVASVLIAALVFAYREFINAMFIPHHDQPISFSTEFSWASVLILGVLTNVAAQFGDLFESALKRGAGVKDSGTLLPGHGGILDRIDALLFAIPTVWYYATFVGRFELMHFYHPIKP